MLVQSRLKCFGQFIAIKSRSPLIPMSLVLITLSKSGFVDVSSHSDQISAMNELFPVPSGILTGISYGTRLI